MKEVWKDIPNYEGLYRISSKGQILRIRRGKVKRPTITTSANGYTSQVVSLSANGVQSRHHVHILVYATFRGKPNGMIDFKDGDKQNLSVDNLDEVRATNRFIKAHCI
ncbi:NUMOD4 domain-containing protein [Sphingobacterium corticibacter]|nr:NUMOD4 domain-containing protein [Sphingobacterium corticibacter]